MIKRIDIKQKKLIIIIVALVVILTILVYFAFNFISGHLSGTVTGVWSDGYNYFEFRENGTFGKWYSDSKNYEIVGQYTLGILSGSLTLDYNISDNGTKIPMVEKYTIEIVTTDRSFVGGGRETVMKLKEDLGSVGVIKKYGITELTYIGPVGSYNFS